jgi:oligoribonuclease NrnB/cAMP/cGMP phosphodiesterase (DHH superfamily)
MDLYNITHMSDMDGMGSAALLMHYYGLKRKNLAFLAHSKDVLAKIFRFIGNIKGSGNILVFSDVGIDPQNVPGLKRALSAFNKRGNLVIWLDHHPWEPSVIKSISPFCYVMIVGENMTTCGADLVYRTLCKKDSFGDTLSHLSHKSDFPRERRTAKEHAQVRRLEFAIKYLGGGDLIDNPRLKSFVGDLSKGRYDSPLIMKAWKGYLKEERRYMELLKSTTSVLQLKKTRIAIGFSKRLQHTAACIDMMRMYKADVVIFVNMETRRCSIRADTGFDTSAYAHSFGGGGHVLASGFALERYDVDLSNQKDRERILSILESRAKKFYK